MTPVDQGSHPTALLVVVAVEEPVRIFSTARTDGEQARLEDDLHARGEAVLEALANVLVPEVRCSA